MAKRKGAVDEIAEAKINLEYAKAIEKATGIKPMSANNKSKTTKKPETKRNK